VIKDVTFSQGGKAGEDNFVHVFFFFPSKVALTTVVRLLIPLRHAPTALPLLFEVCSFFWVARVMFVDQKTEARHGFFCVVCWPFGPLHLDWLGLWL